MNSNIPVNLVFTKVVDVTFCEASIVLGTEVYRSKGYAKRHPKDKFDAEIAEKLSAARALSGLSDKLLKQANGKVKCNDDNNSREHKPNPLSLEFDPSTILSDPFRDLKFQTQTYKDVKTYEHTM